MNGDPVTVIYDSPDPMTAGELLAVDRLIDAGLLEDGDRLTPQGLAELLGCRHRANGTPCGDCLGQE